MANNSGIRQSPTIIEGLFSFELGGSERVGADVARECVRRGYKVAAFAFYGSDGPVRRELEAAGVECFDLSYLTRTRFIRRFTYQLALWRFFRRIRPHAIHIHHCTSLILGALAARRAGIGRIVLTEHSMLELVGMPTYRRQSRHYCRFADEVTVVHPSMKSFFLSELAVPAERLHYIPNGVRLQAENPLERAQVRRTLGIPDTDFLWIFAGRLAEVKDLPTLIRAFAIARGKSQRKLRLMLVGDGDQRSHLEQLSRELGLGASVSFLGARLDVPSLMVAADGFALSSRSEGLPMVLLEAMAAHVPCVATAVGGIPELLSGGAGVVSPPGDPAQLASALLEVAANPSMRRTIAATGFAKVASTNNLDEVVDRYLALFALPTYWPTPAD
jgi:glycosyltransferase involved in cell wall biosynthesis